MTQVGSRTHRTWGTLPPTQHPVSVMKVGTRMMNRDGTLPSAEPLFVKLSPFIHTTTLQRGHGRAIVGQILCISQGHTARSGRARRPTQLHLNAKPRHFTTGCVFPFGFTHNLRNKTWKRRTVKLCVYFFISSPACLSLWEKISFFSTSDEIDT